MVGWHISVFRQEDGGKSPATATSPKGSRLAVWQTHLEGKRWIDELVTRGEAINLGGNGYPYRYTAVATRLIQPILDGPPFANPVWASGEHDILLPHWAGKTVIDHEQIASCGPDEWLIVVIFDES